MLDLLLIFFFHNGKLLEDSFNESYHTWFYVLVGTESRQGLHLALILIKRAS